MDRHAAIRIAFYALAAFGIASILYDLFKYGPSFFPRNRPRPFTVLYIWIALLSSRRFSRGCGSKRSSRVRLADQSQRPATSRSGFSCRPCGDISRMSAKSRHFPRPRQIRTLPRGWSNFIFGRAQPVLRGTWRRAPLMPAVAPSCYPGCVFLVSAVSVALEVLRCCRDCSLGSFRG